MRWIDRGGLERRMDVVVGESMIPVTNVPWTKWVPMQTSPQAHEELFAAAGGRPPAPRSSHRERANHIAD